MTNATNKFLASDDRTFELGSGERKKKRHLLYFFSYSPTRVILCQMFCIHFSINATYLV